ncbi:MAG: DUF2065 domain-containing protein [Desulfocapsaceae bacterium]|nr:DUF2065 domain-containing protein [Desulfocapsaceae bacterium]
MKLLLLLVGVVLVLEGLPYAAAPDIMRGWLEKLSRTDAKYLRIIGLTSVLSGLCLCWLVNRGG